MNEDDAKDAAWDSIIGVEGVSIWFDSLPDSEAAIVRAIFIAGWSGKYLHDQMIDKEV